MAKVKRWIKYHDKMFEEKEGAYVLYDDVKHLIDHQCSKLVVTDEMVERAAQVQFSTMARGHQLEEVDCDERQELLWAMRRALTAALEQGD